MSMCFPLAVAMKLLLPAPVTPITASTMSSDLDVSLAVIGDIEIGDGT